MNAPQWIFAALIAIRVAYGIWGTPPVYETRAEWTLSRFLNASITLWLLHWGGFWG